MPCDTHTHSVCVLLPDLRFPTGGCVVGEGNGDQLSAQQQEKKKQKKCHDHRRRTGKLAECVSCSEDGIFFFFCIFFLPRRIVAFPFDNEIWCWSLRHTFSLHIVWLAYLWVCNFLFASFVCPWNMPLNLIRDFRRYAQRSGLFTLLVLCKHMNSTQKAMRCEQQTPTTTKETKLLNTLNCNGNCLWTHDSRYIWPSLVVMQHALMSRNPKWTTNTCV